MAARIHIFIAMLFAVTPLWAGTPPCKRGFADIAASFLVHPTEVDSAAVVINEKNVLQSLSNLGVGYTATTKESMLRAGSEAKQVVVTSESGEAQLGTVYKITSLPAPNKKSSPYSPALSHEDMPAYLKILEAANVDLVVDPSALLLNRGGYFHPRLRTIAIFPDTPWHVFIHEFDHFEYFQNIAMHIPDLQMIHRGKEDFFRSIPNAAAVAIGKDKLVEIEKLVKRGVTEKQALVETLAIHRQLKLLGWRGYIPGNGSADAKTYELSVQISAIEDLIKSGEASEFQIQSLKALKAKAFYMNFHDVIALPMAGIAIGTLALDAKERWQEKRRQRNASDLNRASVKQVLYDENGNVLIEGNDGNWELLKRNSEQR